MITYHNMTPRQMAEIVVGNFNYNFPEVGKAKPNLLDKLSEDLRKFNGIKGSPIEIFPGILETDKRFLKLKLDVMRDLELISTEDTENGAYLGTGIPKKDIGRIGCIMSADVEPTYVSTNKAVELVYSEEYYKWANFAIEYMCAKSGFLPGMYTHKRRESSNGCITKESDLINYKLEQDALINHINDPTWLDRYYDCRKFASPLTRRMGKTNKKRIVADVNGNDHEHDRTLKGTMLNEVAKAGLDPNDFYTAQHRIALNVTEYERAAQVLDQHFVEGIKDAFHIQFKHTEEFIPLILKTGKYIPIASDGVMFDQSVNDKIIDKIEESISTKVKIFDYKRFRASKDTVWYNPDTGKMVSLTSLCHEKIGDKKRHYYRLYTQGKITEKEYNYAIQQVNEKALRTSILALDSGMYKVSNVGKIARVTSEFAMFQQFIDDTLCDNIESFLACTRMYSRERAEYLLKKNGVPYVITDSSHRDAHYIFVDSSDDFYGLTSELWLREVIMALFEWNSNKVIKSFIPVEEDPEYLSMITIKYKGELLFVPNIVRRVAVMLAPEYSVNNNNGTYRDVRISFQAKIDEIMKHPNGHMVIDVLNRNFIKHFGMDMMRLCEFTMRGKRSATEETINAFNAKRIKIDDSLLKIINNPDYAHYRDDLLSNIPDEAYDVLFANLSPTQTIRAFKNAGKMDVLAQGYKTYESRVHDLEVNHNKLASIIGIPEQQLCEALHFDKIKTRAQLASKLTSVDDVLLYYDELTKQEDANTITISISAYNKINYSWANA